MRRIQTQAEIDKRKHRNQVLLGMILVFLLIFSTLGYSLMRGDNKNNSGKVSELGFDFYKENGIWKVLMDSNVFGFQYLPSEVSNISISGIYDIEQYHGQPVYFIGNNEGTSEILSNIIPFILRYQEACLDNESCNGNFPIKNCDSNLIIFEPGNETMIYQNESCVYIVGDYTKGADAFLYKALHFQ